MLGALILIFVYLIWVALPLFSDATFKVENRHLAVPCSTPAFLALDEYGQSAFIVDESGKTEFLSLAQKQTDTVLGELPFKPIKWYRSTTENGVLAVGDGGQSILISPHFSDTHAVNKTISRPFVERISLSPILRTLIKNSEQISFTILSDRLIMVIYDNLGKLHWVIQSLEQPAKQPRIEILPGVFTNIEELRITPDGNTLYIRESASELMVAKINDKQAYVREIVDISQKNTSVVSMQLLPGASSLLIVYANGKVIQWFDVLKNGHRKLTHIRDFTLGSGLSFILPNMYSKGFFAFYENGSVYSYFTTSEKLILFERAYRNVPDLAAFSKDERKLVTINHGNIYLADVDLGYPDVSFSALWDQVWYENYPEPEYIWQSTSASDTFEPKFSLVPIAFGTIKAAAYAMLFSVPIAIFAAIYTAYFMTPKMRRVVKPTIELMEALPTVIIGFLAGLWFAPLVERNLVMTVLMVVVLPVSAIIVGALWRLLPKSYNRWTKRGWHTLVLFPALIVVIVIVLPLSFDIERLLFGGDIRVFLADYGFNFDQRNALVVGLAMGFAVIPTIFTIAEDAVFSVPKHLSDASLALGATQWQTLKHVVLQTASPGVFSAIMMGLGRAVGETMIVLMATGNTPIMDWNILEGMRTLAATIAVELPESEVGSSHYRILFLAALILFVFTFIVNSLAEWIRLRLREKYRAL